MINPRLFLGVCLLACMLSVPAAPAVARTLVLVDFGTNATPSPTNGVHWNNYTATGTTLSNLATTNNTTTGWSLSLATAGGLGGGTWVPVTTTNLGLFNEPTAANDGLFLVPADGTRTVRVAGLATNRSYDLALYAGRDATEIRTTRYTVRGAATNTNTLTTSGTGIGAGGVNYNNTSFLLFTNLAPDTNGQLLVDYTVAAGGFGYLNALYIAENAVATNPAGQEILIDFGPTNTPTTNAASGNVWNNFTAGSSTNILDTRGTNTGYQFAFVTAAAVNTDTNILPSPALGALAETNAVSDWLFVTNDPAGHTFKIAGLSRSNAYTFRLYGARSATETRVTTYTVTGTNTASGTLTTSGSGIGGAGTNYNSTNVLTLSNVMPDRNGEISVNYRVTTGSFGYLNALQITTTNFPGPSPAYLATANRLRDQDLLDPPPANAVLFFGSSSIRRWESLAKSFADYRVIQRGFGGATFTELNQLLGDVVIPYAPRAIVLWAGANDLYAGRTAAEVLGEYTNFVGAVTNALPSTEILYLGMTRNPGTANDAAVTLQRTNANALIGSFIASSGNPRLRYVDLPAFFETLSHTNTNSLSPLLSTNDLWNYYVDTLHANEAGYEVWRTNIRSALAGAGILPDRPAGTNTSAPGQKILFDFGPGDTNNGDLTTGLDAFANRWNNWYPIAGGASVTTGERVVNLVNTAGMPTGIDLTLTGGFSANGKLNGGLTNSPAPSLGHLGIVTATGDYFFSTADAKPGGGSDDQTAGFRISGLDPGMLYDLRFFGSRSISGTRQTIYRVQGANSNSATLQTSGTGIGSGGGSGNDSAVALTAGLRPNVFGDLFLDISAVQQSTNAGDPDTVAYLNAMEITSVSNYQGWARARGLTSGVNDGLAQVAGPSGRPNAWHFAFGSDPLAPGAPPMSFGAPVLQSTNESRHLAVTVPMRRGTVLTGQPPTSAFVDGISYRVTGSADLEGTALDVEEVAAADTGNLPPLGDFDGDGQPDYEYRTFRLADPLGSISRGFLRVEIVTP